MLWEEHDGCGISLFFVWSNLFPAIGNWSCVSACCWLSPRMSFPRCPVGFIQLHHPCCSLFASQSQCTYENKARRQVCEMCQGDRPQPDSKNSTQAKETGPATAGSSGGGGGGKETSPDTKMAPASGDPEVWACPRCTLENQKDNTKCEACETDRPRTQTPASSGK